MIPLGLRIDVDTLRGARQGVPVLLDILAAAGVRATFFFSVGPDNMGRHLYRLANPAFCAKMLRSRAPSLYGWEILLRGLLWPGPRIGPRCAALIQRAAAAGHEIGLHAWDHHAWQARAGRWSEAEYTAHIARGWRELTRIAGRPPVAAAAPAWRITEAGLRARSRFPAAYNSDCRGKRPFQPLVDGAAVGPPQVPTTLPTYDEVVGRTCRPDTYNAFIFRQIHAERCNVLTVHAEVEGGVCRELFARFLQQAAKRDIRPVPLGRLARPEPGSDHLPPAPVRRATAPGRAGWLAVQGPTSWPATPTRKELR